MTHPTGVPLASLWSPWRLHGCSSGLHCCSFCALTISLKEPMALVAFTISPRPCCVTILKASTLDPPYTNTTPPIPNNPHPLYPKIPHPSPIITPMSPSESQLSPPELPPARREIKVYVLSHASPPDDRGTRAGGNLTSMIFFRMFSFHSFSLGWLLGAWLACCGCWLAGCCWLLAG